MVRFSVVTGQNCCDDIRSIAVNTATNDSESAKKKSSEPASRIIFYVGYEVELLRLQTECVKLQWWLCCSGCVSRHIRGLTRPVRSNRSPNTSAACRPGCRVSQCRVIGNAASRYYQCCIAHFPARVSRAVRSVAVQPHNCADIEKVMGFWYRFRSRRQNSCAGLRHDRRTRCNNGKTQFNDFRVSALVEQFCSRQRQDDGARQYSGYPMCTVESYIKN